MPSYVLIAYVALLCAFSLLRVVHIRSPIAQRLRIFFPSWKFFEDIDDVPALLFRIDSGSGVFGPWCLCLPKLQRRWTALFLNAEANLFLAYGSLVQQLIADLPDDPAVAAPIEDSASYTLTHALVRRRLTATGALPAGGRYQFKIAVAPPGDPPERGHDILLSPIYPSDAA